MRKHLLIASFTLFFALLGGYAMAQDNIKIMVNGVLIKPSTPPQIIDNRVMVPLRSIAKSLNADVAWESNTSTVKINTDDSNAAFNFMKLNGKATTWPYWEENGKVFVVVEHYADLMRRYYSVNSAISSGENYVAKDNRSYTFKPVKKGDFNTVSLQDLLLYGHFIPYEWDSTEGNLIIDNPRIK